MQPQSVPRSPSGTSGEGCEQAASFRTSDVDEARAAVGSEFFPHRLAPLDRAANFGMAMRSADLGSVTVGKVEYDAAPVSLDFGELGDFYHFSVPISGRVKATCGSEETLATPTRGIVYLPVGRTVITHWSADCAQYGVKFERIALERELEQLLGHSVRSPVRFAHSLDLSTGRGESFMGLVRTLASELDVEGGLVYNPLLARQLVRTVTTGLLLSTEHDYSNELQRSGAPARPRTVRRAIEAMRAAPEHPHTVNDLAETSGCCVRSLQVGFAQHVGMSPMEYLRDLRLERAHEDLRHPNGPASSVADIAHSWGFRHLGRFAADYRRKYDEAPSQTLRSR